MAKLSDLFGWKGMAGPDKLTGRPGGRNGNGGDPISIENLSDVGSRLGEDTGPPLREAMEQFERQYILRVLEGTSWNVSRAARRLGVHRNTVLTKLSGWGIQRPGSGEGRNLSL